MKKRMMNVVVALTGLLFSSMAFAQTGGDNSRLLIPVGAGLAIGLAAFGAASGQGKTASAALEGLARNPNAKDALFQPFILGLVFMELQALLGFVIAIIWTTAK